MAIEESLHLQDRVASKILCKCRKAFRLGASISTFFKKLMPVQLELDQNLNEIE